MNINFSQGGSDRGSDARPCGPPLKEIVTAFPGISDMKYFTWIIVFLSFALPARPDDFPKFTVTVRSPDKALHNVPVSVELKLGDHLTPAEAELLSEGATALIPNVKDAQADLVKVKGNTVGSLLVHWIEPHLPANTTKTVQLTVEPRCECESTGFRIEEALDYRDLWYEGNPVFRHMTAPRDPAEHADTFMPFHHLFSFHDEGFLTKGPGGDHPHHRGIFFAFNTNHGNFWAGAKNVYQQHVRYLAHLEKIGPVAARTVSLTDWRNADGTLVATDTRDVRAWWINPKLILLDFTITLEPQFDKLTLGGDAHHAGLHVRAAQEVSLEKAKSGSAKFTVPDGAKTLPNEIIADAPWVAMTFPIQGNAYTIAQFDHPENPKPTLFSTRAYGRMGAYFTRPDKTPVELKEGQPLILRYRFAMMGGKKSEPPNSETLGNLYSAFTSPVRATVERAKR